MHIRYPWFTIGSLFDISRNLNWLKLIDLNLCLNWDNFLLIECPPLNSFIFIWQRSLSLFHFVFNNIRLQFWLIIKLFYNFTNLLSTILFYLMFFQFFRRSSSFWMDNHWWLDWYECRLTPICIGLTFSNVWQWRCWFVNRFIQ